MARKSTAVPGSGAPKKTSTFKFSSIFKSGRQIFWFSLFVLWICIDCAALGLVSQQIHNHSRDVSSWPSKEYQNAMGLLLFASIFSLLFGIFHWAASLPMYLFLFLGTGVFWGTGAGIIEKSPFGHGLQCGLPASHFAAPWDQFVGDCSRWTAIEGLSWSMFALAVIGFFFTIIDRFEFTVKRSVVYDVEAPHEEIKEEH